MLTIRTKTIVAIVAVILSISAAYFFFFFRQREHSLQLVMNAQKELVTALVDLMIEEVNLQYRSRIKSFSFQYAGMIRDFAEQNRERLYKEVLPVFKNYQNEDRYFDHIDFVLPDNTVFLRMQEPEKYGDRGLFPCPIYSDLAPDPEKGTTGFIYGDCGLLYRVTQPLFYQNRFVGEVQFGIRIGAVIGDIIKGLDVHTALALRKYLIDKEDQDSRDTESDNYYIHDLSDSFIKELAGRIELTGGEQRCELDGAVHFIFPSYIIRDEAGREIGRILHGVDLTAMTTSYHEDIILLTIITLSVLVVASLILFGAFSKLIGDVVALNRELEQKNRELTDAGQQLEEQVIKRTSELEEANTHLIREIEERQEANLSLVRSIEEWQSTFDSIADPVTILDTNLEVVIANRAAHELLTKDDREIVGRSCYELFADSVEPCELCPAQEVFAGGMKKEYEIEHDYLGKTMLVSCVPIYDKGNGGVSGYIHTARDITEEKILKKQLSQAQKMESIATLAGGIAHDFNNILGAILGNADLLLYRLASSVKGNNQLIRDLPPEEIATHIEAIKKAGHRAKELVSQILAFSRQSKSHRQNVLITPVIKEGIKLLRSSLAANIEITSSVEPEPCHINADLTQIHQVFMNLCTNAAQAMATKGGVLDISLQNVEADVSTRKTYPDLHPGRYLSLAVKDTGHGMTREIMERIFDPFFTTRDVGEGTGMGLSVIHGIITAHNGVLDVKSKVDVGSVFTVFFPCVNGEQEVVEDPVLGVPQGMERVLFIDDEHDIVKMSGSMLQYLGYTVFSATSAEKALEMLGGEASDVDIVISDYSMPGMSGTDLAGEIARMKPDLPVILCSGFSESVVLDEHIKKVIRKFMSKPLDMKKLAVAIREVLS